MSVAQVYSKIRWKYVIGVVGGVGPEATVAFYASIVSGRARLFQALQNAVLVGRDPLETAQQLSFAAWTRSEIARIISFPCPIMQATLSDQHHLPVVIYSNPQIPDRTRFILAQKSGEMVTSKQMSPLPLMISTAQELVSAGANRIAIPCNTAHYFVPKLREVLPSSWRGVEGIEVMDMLALTLGGILRKFANLDGTPVCVGLLATSGTVTSGIYRVAAEQAAAHGAGVVELLSPADVPGGNQHQVDEAIFGPCGIKAGYSDSSTSEGAENLRLLLDQSRRLAANNCKVIISGCTELPLILTQQAADAHGLAVTVVDPSVVLADEAVRVALLGRWLENDDVP